MHGVHQIDQVPINQINILSIEHLGIDILAHIQSVSYHCHSDGEVWSQSVIRVTHRCTQGILINASLVYEM